MSICEVLGGSKYQKELAYRVVCHCVNDLNLVYHNIDITVKITNLSGHAGTDLYALVEQTDANKYLIQLERTLNLEMFVKYLCHEMVHLMQYTQGALKEIHNAEVSGTVFWMGDLVQEQDYAYADQPWEAQAFALQESLSESFFLGLDVNPTHKTFKSLCESQEFSVGNP